METVQSFANTAPAQPGGTGSAQQVITSDFTTFLRMLTAQMENQDPLNPMDTDDFATQLATFSSVEQQVRANTLLEQIAGGQGAPGIAAFASWIGKEALVAAPAQFSGSPVELHPDIAGQADAATLVVRDAAGAVVQTQPLPMSGQPVQWAGVDAAGAPFPAGRYAFAVESTAGGQLIDTRPVRVYAEIRETRIVDGQPVLLFDTGTTALPADVTGLRQP